MLSTLILAQREDVTAWFTPLWMLSVGVTLGVILVVLFLGLINGLSRIPKLNTLADDPKTRFTAGAILTLVIVGVLVSLVFAIDIDRLSSYDTILTTITAEREKTQQDNGELRFLLIILSVIAAPLLAFGGIALVSEKRRPEVMRAPWEGFLFWISAICLGLVAFCGIGILLSLVSGLNFAVVDLPVDRLKSIPRLAATGTFQESFTIPVSDPDSTGHEIDVAFNGPELNWIEFKNDQRLEIGTRPITPDLRSSQLFRNVTSETGRFFSRTEDLTSDSRIPLGATDSLFVKNLGDADTELTVRWNTQPEYPQVSGIPKIAIAVFGVYLLVLILVALFPKISAIALSTFKTEISQPIFIILLIIGGVFMVASIYIPYNTFGEDIKMYQGSGLTLLRVLAIFMAIWAASKSVAEEIEGRTALTVLSKPVGRRQFIFGKYFGISLAVGLLFVVLGLWFIFWTSYKPIYDSVETAERKFSWLICYEEAFRIVPGLILGYLEAIIFVAISVAISTRVGILPNFLICFAIYVLGHLTPLIVQSAEVANSFEGVVVFGQAVATIVPVLDHLDVQAAINGDARIPAQYIGWVGVYALLYSSIAMLLALTLFEDRDLA